MERGRLAPVVIPIPEQTLPAVISAKNLPIQIAP